MRGTSGCIIDIVLVGLALTFPPIWIVIFPLWCYDAFIAVKEYYYKCQIDDFLKNELKKMTPQQIEEKRIAYTIILHSPYSTRQEKATAEYAIRFIEKYCYKKGCR